MKIIHPIIVGIALLIHSLGLFAQTETTPGTFAGAKEFTHPEWFKESFLDLEEDIADAEAEGKRLILYFWQPGCPYCAELISNNLAVDDIKAKIREKFDVIALNMWGDREVVQVGGRSFTEKTLATALHITYTPTLLFFTESKTIALRLDGYVAPEKFRLALNYVSLKKENNLSFSEFVTLENQNSQTVDASEHMHAEPFFVTSTNDLHHLVQNKDGITAVYFEQSKCASCDTLHLNILRDEETRSLASNITSLQIDINASEDVITPSGNDISIKQWVTQLGIHHTPTIIFYDKNGKEIVRMDSELKSFHVQSIFDYVSSKTYLHEKNFQRFISERADQHIKAGKDVDIWAN